jgi:flagellar hook-associated protein 2
MGDVIRTINSADVGVTARINDTGDGLLLTDTAGGPAAMTVAEASGTAARDLNILGEAQSGAINGSYELKLDLSAGTTLQDVVDRINGAGGSPVSANILNDGTGVSPYRLQLTADNSGSLGEFVLDTGTTGVDFSTLSRAQDAHIVLGGGDGGIMVVSATNTITNVVPGLSLTLTEASDKAVTVTVSRDYSSAKTAIDGLVTAFNDAVDHIREASGYNAETDEKGILLGDATVKNVESRLLRAMTGSIPGGSGAVKRWAQLGIKLANGKLQFDQAKFDAAFSADPQAVIDAFTRPESGIAATLKKTLEDISDSSDGMIARRNNALETQKDDLNDRIDSLNELLDRKRQRLMRQFQAMESAISQLQSQGSALSQIGPLSVPGGR